MTARRRRVLKITGLFTVLVLGISSQLPATQVSLGTIGIIPNLGVADYQQVLLYNQTASLNSSDCAAQTTLGVCDAINITNWTVEVDYTQWDPTANGGAGGQVAQAPIFNSGTVIAPGNDPTTAPLAALPFTVTNSCPPCDTIVTRVVFTANLPAAGFTVGANGATSTFFPLTPFTFSNSGDPLNPAYIPSADYLAGNSPGGDVADFLVQDNPNGGGGGTGGVPEPASVVMMLGGALLLGARRLIMR